MALNTSKSNNLEQLALKGLNVIVDSVPFGPHRLENKHDPFTGQME